MAAAVMFLLATIATNGEPDTPSNLGWAYFFLFFANLFFSHYKEPTWPHDR